MRRYFPNEDEKENQKEQPIQEQPPPPELRRSSRERQPFKKYCTNEFVLLSDQGEPKTSRNHEKSKQGRMDKGNARRNKVVA